MFRRMMVFTLLLVFALSGVAYLQPPKSSAVDRFTGIDLVIAIDQSGSMWGLPPKGTDPGHPAKNDKYKHRIGQAKNVIYRLAEHIEHIEDKTILHKVSVIDFGDKASVALSAHVIAFDSAEPGAALRETKAVIEHNVTEKELINTNTPEAMALALKEFEKMAASAPPSGRRRKLLILTDGRANLPGVAPNQMRERVKAQVEALKGQGIELWVIGLNDADNYWNEGDGAFWKSQAGNDRALLADTASSDIFTLVQGIVDKWLDAKGIEIADDEYQCPPYLGRIVFDVNFGTPRADIHIFDPDGTEISLSSGGAASKPGTFSRFVVENPRPGIYKIQKDPSRSYTIRVEEYSPSLKRLSPAGKASLGVETAIIFQASNTKDEPIQLLPEWPLTSTVELTAPSGKQQILPATYEGDGKFQARWTPEEYDIHKVKLVGLVPLKDGTTRDVFNASAHSYDEEIEVSHARPVFLQLNDPDPVGSVAVMRAETTIKVEFSLVNAKKEKIVNFDDLVKDPSTWLSLQLISKYGEALDQPLIPLTFNDSGNFAAEIPVHLNWKKGEGYAMAQNLNLRVLPQVGRMIGDNFLDSIYLPPRAESRRIKGDPMTVGPIPISFSWLILAAILVLIFAPLALALWFWWPRLVYRWMDSSRGRNVAIKIYDGNNDPTGEYADKYLVSNRSRFNLDGQVSVLINGQKYYAKRFRVKRSSPFGPQKSVAAMVEYQWDNETGSKPHTLRLFNGRPKTLTGLPPEEDKLIRLDAT
jgi:von Willebrand factor type A domain-containing protein